MTKSFEELLAARLPIQGLAACVIRLSDGTVSRKCFTRWLSPTQVQQAVVDLVQASDALQRHQIVPRRMVWVFEHLRVVVHLRPDKACLALFLENRQDLSLAEIQAVLDEFAELPALAQ